MDLPPLPGGWDGGDGFQLLVDAHEADVAVRLDAGGAAGPRPRGRPDGNIVRDGGHRGALGAGARGGGAPVVLVDGVWGVVPLVEGVAGLRRPGFEGRRGRRGRGGEGAGRGQEEGGDLGGELHLGQLD